MTQTCCKWLDKFKEAKKKSDTNQGVIDKIKFFSGVPKIVFFDLFKVFLLFREPIAYLIHIC